MITNVQFIMASFAIVCSLVGVILSTRMFMRHKARYDRMYAVSAFAEYVKAHNPALYMQLPPYYTMVLGEKRPVVEDYFTNYEEQTKSFEEDMEFVSNWLAVNQAPGILIRMMGVYPPTNVNK